MPESKTHVITGAFGFTGQYIARRLLAAGADVRALTHSPNRPHEFGDRVRPIPFHFDQPDRLAESLRGADALFNTYWVRFNHRDFTFAQAVANTRILFDAAKSAGVRRIVHVSITNPSEDSPLEYFRGKAQLERALRDSGVSYAILRPALVFGDEDILINNMAWMLRKLPIFGVFGDGTYRVQPIFVDDLAALAVHQARERENVVIDAIGPETFTYRELVESIAGAIGVHRRVVSVPPTLGYLIGTAIGWIVRDRLITRDEIRGLMADLLYTHSPPAGTTRFTEWLRDHADTLGRHYASELGRRRNCERSYVPA